MRGDIMINDSLEKTVHIPVRIINGEIRYLYGGDIPPISNGAEGKLIVREHDVEDKKFISISQFEDKIEILPENTVLMFAVNPSNVPEDKIQNLKSIRTIDSKSYMYVEAKLSNPLILQIRGSKMSNLLKVSCIIPSLNNIEASSINNAYTIISQEYEPKRKSHTGNVFDKCYYLDDDKKWHPLEDLRNREENKFEEKLFLDNKLYHLVQDVRDHIYGGMFNRNVFNDKELTLIDYLYDFKYITGCDIKELFKNNKRDYINTINNLLDRKVIYEFK